MDLKKLAENIIEYAEGLTSEKNIDGVAEILEAYKKTIDVEWEEHLAGQSAETLMYDEVLCGCGQLIEITRKRHRIDVEFV